jgi:hypothetical protein
MPCALYSNGAKIVLHGFESLYVLYFGTIEKQVPFYCAMQGPRAYQRPMLDLPVLRHACKNELQLEQTTIAPLTL